MGDFWAESMRLASPATERFFMPFGTWHGKSRLPGTKFMKFGLKYSILHLEIDKTIKFERI